MAVVKVAIKCVSFAPQFEPQFGYQNSIPCRQIYLRNPRPELDYISIHYFFHFSKCRAAGHQNQEERKEKSLLTRFYLLLFIHNPLRIKGVIHKGQSEVNSEFICKERGFLFHVGTLSLFLLNTLQ